MREQQRVDEAAHVGPGCYRGNELDFGKDSYYKVTISNGKKYYPKKDKTPAPS